MNDEQFGFLKALVESTGPSGNESETQALWRERVQGVAQSVRRDSLGNNLAVLNEAGIPRLMIDAHADEIGLLIKQIDERGFLYFDPIGLIDASTLPGNRVRIVGSRGPVLGVMGRKPAHLLTQGESDRAPSVKDMWIDIGARDRAEAEALVTVGDAGGRIGSMERMTGDLVVGKSMDDRVGCYVLAEAFRELSASAPPAAVFAVSSTQEEVGYRGAQVTANSANASIGLALEVTHSSDHPGMNARESGDIRLGGGPVISRGVIFNERVGERLVAAAVAEGLGYQVEAEPGVSSTNSRVMQIARSGMAVGMVCVPLRYMHTASEVISLTDVDAAVKMVVRFVRDLDADVNLIP